MKGCTAGLAALLLLAALGYALFELHSLRSDVAALRVELRASRQGSGPRSARRPAQAPPADPAETARRALEALRKGNFGLARQELDRLSRDVARTTTLAEQEKVRWQKRIKAAESGLAQRSGAARRSLEDLERELAARSGSRDK